MVYLVAALAQFCVILLTQIAVMAGYIVGSTALVILLGWSAFGILHALIRHRTFH